MITLRELVEDPAYRKYLQTRPKLPDCARDPERVKTPPWVVYVQREMDGPWGRKDFWDYGAAFKFLARQLRSGCHDAALNCRRIGFEPPSKWVRVRGKYVVGSDGVKRQAMKLIVWKPKLQGDGLGEHHWCKYCRRPTHFRYFRKHRRLPVMDPTRIRCVICGASAQIAFSVSNRGISSGEGR